MPRKWTATIPTETPMAKETVLELDLSALEHNYRYFRAKLEQTTKFMGVVKAYGYGSDAVAMAQKLEQLGADYLAVAYVAEGVALRQEGIGLPILVLHPQKATLAQLLDHNLEPNLYSPYILTAFAQVAREKGISQWPVHLKFNTGLNRLGFSLEDLDSLLGLLAEHPELEVVSVFSHLAASEDLNEKEFTLGQIHQFQKIHQAFEARLGRKVLKHILNTSGIVNYAAHQLDMVRCGIGLHGYGNTPEIDRQLRPFAALKTVISQLHSLEEGDTVGYNRAFTSQQPRVTATLPLGHADGIGRPYGKGKTAVNVNGHLAPIIGNVCMDMIMVDVTNIPCKAGDEVTIFGEQPSAEEFAHTAGTISYELLTGISQRVKRIILPQK